MRILVQLVWIVSVSVAEKNVCANNTSNKNGGWILPHEFPVGHNGPCNIERVNGEFLTQEEFLERYAYSKPAIIYNVENRRFQEKCEKNRMLEEWYGTTVVLNSANTYSYSRVQTTFDEYITRHLKPQNLSTLGNETLYLFGDIDQEIWKPLLDQYQMPKWTVPDHEPALSFGIAGAGTGVPFHFHGPGFAEVIHGSKRWFLQPFDERPEFDPDKSTLDWYLNDYPKLPEEKKPLECLLRPGELIYFPDKWWHATLNSETSVFISTFLSPFMMSGSSAKIEL
uniref:JmjC domain-containing protein n=1 Tax=Acrobeloides nanus TaxID=290746 RepID=A0A914CBP2_9BILA